MKNVDVLIIGSGWSGLAAARHIKENSSSTQVLILEGRDYVGGRSRSIRTPNGRLKAELGSQWIHGGCMKNPMYKLAKEHGCELQQSPKDSGIVYSEVHGNQKIPVPLSSTQIDEFEGKFLYGKNGFKAYIARRQDEDKDKSLRVVLDDYKRKQKASPVQLKMMEWMADQTLPQEYGASLEDLSLWWFDSDTDFEGEDVHFVEGGYSALVDRFAAPVYDHIQLQSKVSSIDWTSSPVKVQYGSSKDDSPITIAASHVILTVPLGVLKAKIIDFVPALPKSKQRAIQKVGFGLLNKIILIWDKKDKLPWSDYQNVNWIERIPESSPQGLWTEFYTTTTPEGNPIMYGFSAGRLAKQIEQLSDEDIKSQSLAALRSVCPQGTTIADPAEIIITRWGQDEFSYGAYSYNQLGGEPKDRRNLGAPLENRLFFAGEATHRKYFSTTHGALLSGVDAARLVLAQTKRRTS